MIKAAVLLCSAFLVALLGFGLARSTPDQTIDTALADGKSVAPPSFELDVLKRGQLGPRLDAELAPAFADNQLTSEELRGTPTVVNFWASWCPPCRDEAPTLERTWLRLRAQGVLLLGLNMQDVDSDAMQFIDEYGLTYPNVRDGTDRVARAWGAVALPETYFLAADGKVAAHVIGAISAQQLRRGVAAARAGRPLGTLSGGDRRDTR